MEEYLKTLGETIQKKGLSQFCVFPDDKPFKIIKKDRDEIKQILKKSPSKYAGRKIAVITLNTRKSGFQDNKHIFSIAVHIYRISEDGLIAHNSYNDWGLLLFFMEEDLENHPFTMKRLEKIVNLVNKRKIESGLFGITYSEYEKDIQKLKDKKKKASRTKKLSKKYKSKSSKKTIKRSKKYNIQ